MKSLPKDIYSPYPAAGMRDAARRSASGPTRLLQAQIARGFHSLRFRRRLESDFCLYLRKSGRLSRGSLSLMSLLGVVLVMMIDRPILAMPEVLLMPTRLLQFGLMIPATVICGVFCWCWPRSRAVEPMMLLFFIAMNIGMIGERAISSRYGFDVPAEMSGVTIVAMFALARIRFWLMLPAALFVAAGAVIAEALLVDAGSSAYYHFFSASLLLFIGILAGYSSEYFIRWTWLNGALLRHMSRLDSLTGLLNRQALEDALERAHEHAQREGVAYAVAMIDIDAFGAYNDHYGHQAGDAALRRVANELNQTARRPQDVCGRYGGEEFALLWMDGSADEMGALAEQVRAAIEASHIEHEVSPVGPWVTASVGLCHVDPSRGRIGLEAVLGEADRLLYRAKAEGRNRVIVEGFEPHGRRAAAHEEPMPLRRRGNG